MIELHRTYRFCASHVLARPEWSEERNLAVFGTAARASGHGHNYRLTVVMGGEVDPATGRLADLEAVDAVVVSRVIDVYDHKNMNEDVPTLSGRVPTLEAVLEDVWQRLSGQLPSARLLEVRLQQDEFTLGVRRAGGGQSASS